MCATAHAICSRTPVFTFVAVVDAGARDRREHCDLQRGERRAAAPAGVQGPRPPGDDPAHRSDPVAANYIDWRDQSRSFEAMGAAEYWSPNLTGSDPPQSTS